RIPSSPGRLRRFSAKCTFRALARIASSGADDERSGPDGDTKLCFMLELQVEGHSTSCPGLASSLTAALTSARDDAWKQCKSRKEPASWTWDAGVARTAFSPACKADLMGRLHLSIVTCAPSRWPSTMRVGTDWRTSRRLRR